MRRALSKDPGSVAPGAIGSEKKLLKRIFFPLFPLKRYYSAPISPIFITRLLLVLSGLKKYGHRLGDETFPMTTRARRVLSKEPGLVALDAIVSEKKIVKEQFFCPLFHLNRYNSVPIGQIRTKKIWACRARGAHSKEPGLVPLDAFGYNSVPIGHILTKKIRSYRTRRAPSNEPGPIALEKFFFPLFPLNCYNSVPIGCISTKKIWACRARRVLSNGPCLVALDAIVSKKKIKIFFSFVSFKPLLLGSHWAYLYGNNMCYSVGEKNCLRKLFSPLFRLNRYNSVPIRQIWTKKIWACRTRRAPSNRRGTVALGATGRLLLVISRPKNYGRLGWYEPLPLKPVGFLIIFFSLFPLNRYNSVPIGYVCRKKIWTYRTRRSPSNKPGPVALGVTGKIFFPLFHLNRYNSVPIGHILTKKIWAYRTRRAPSNETGPVALGAVGSDATVLPNEPVPVALGATGSRPKKYGRLGRDEPLPLNPVGFLWDRSRRKKYWRVGCDECFRMTPARKKLLKKIFFSLIHFNRYDSVPVGRISTEKAWACRALRALSNVPGPVPLGAIASEKKKRARRVLSKEPGLVALDAIVSEKKIVKEQFFCPLFHLNRYNSVPIVQIRTKKIWACRARGALSKEPGLVPLDAFGSEKKIVKKKFFFPLFPLNCYNSAPIGQILIKKIRACRARRALSNDPDTVFLGAIVSEKKIVKEKIFFPLFPINRYNTVPIGQIWKKKIWACRARRALSSEPAHVALHCIVS
ncbi:LOW QUALITY PROTEIN: hypothetical protein V1477_000094 [Vespula maculifrons]|uniref:Uncharacterized protein n=1 Tax=Vespula maculifrons TaxID=7453 RepID=A0ABD2D2J9_VESMC